MAAVEGLAAATDVEVVFGDYAVQHPSPPSSAGRTFGNVRYTAAEELFVSRGHLMSNMDNADFAAMSRRVVRGGPFSGPDFSWGDAQIYRVAELGREQLSRVVDEVG